MCRSFLMHFLDSIQSTEQLTTKILCLELVPVLTKSSILLFTLLLHTVQCLFQSVPLLC